MLLIILERTKEKVERELAEEQASFRPGRGTGDMLWAIQILIEKLIEVRNEAYGTSFSSTIARRSTV